MALTTLQFWQQQLALCQQIQAAAQNNLTAAQWAQQAANKQLAVDLNALDKVIADIAKKQAQLAATTVPADAAALLAEITAKIIQQRGFQGKVLDDRDELDAAQISQDAANATLARIQAKLSNIQAKIDQAKIDAAQRETLKKAVTTAPLSTLKTDAAAFGNAVAANALKGLKQNFPQDIIDIAGQRYQQRTLRLSNLQAALDDAQTHLGDELGTNGGVQGVASQKLAEFQRAQDEFARYVATAANRYDKARAVMQALEAIALNPAPGILTQAEYDQLVLDANAKPGAAAIGKADPLDQTVLDAVKTAVDDQATAAQKAALQLVAEQDLAAKVLAAAQAADKAAAPDATPTDVADAQDTANAVVAAQAAAALAAKNKGDADKAAAKSAAAAKVAMDTAAPKARTVGVCLDVVFQAQDGLDTQILAQIKADVDLLDSDPAIAAKRAAITLAIASYKAAIASFSAAASDNKGDLDNWQAIIPDAAWKVLLDYEEGLAALNELGTLVDPAKLIADMDAAEDDYTAALDVAEKAQRRIDGFNDAIGLRGLRLASAQAAITARLPSAIRGDSY